MESSPIHSCSFLELSPLNTNQDFCLGAKPAFSPNDVGYPQDPNYLDFDNQINQFDGLNVESLDAFNEVILQDDTSFNLVDDFLSRESFNVTNSVLSSYAEMEIDSALDTDFLPLDTGAISQLELDEYLNSTDHGIISPDIKIKTDCTSFDQQLLKNKFNQPKDFQNKSIGHSQITEDNLFGQSDIFEYKAFDQKKSVDTSVYKPSKITIKLKKFKLKRVPMKRLGEVSKKLQTIPADCRKVPDARMTLRDAINMEGANVILDRLFEHDSGTESDEYSASGSSLSSPSYAAPSPSYLSPDLSDIPVELDQPKSRMRYKCSPTERYVKKKEQNKIAAIRYRNKKRLAEDNLQQIMMDEELKQKELKKTLKNLKQEVKIMKKLMREAFILKGLVSADAFKKSI